MITESKVQNELAKAAIKTLNSEFMTAEEESHLGKFHLGQSHFGHSLGPSILGRASKTIGANFQ